MKKFFGKKVLGLAGFSMAIMLGCTACAGGQVGTPDNDVNQSVNVEKETGDTQENQEINQYVNSEDSDKSNSNFFKEADLQGSVVEFSDSGFEMSIAVTTKEGDSPISGEIDMNGENIEEKGLANHRKNHISLVFQNYNLIDYLTPVENVKLGGNADAEMLLTQMGIDQSTRKRNVMQLSGGQQQRVAIARALASKAPVLLADEPTGNLDEDTAKDIVEIFKSLAHDQDKCVIVVTHSKELAEEADVILTLKQGTVIATEDTVLEERIRG